MSIRTRTRMDELRSGFFIVPGVMTLIAAMLAVVMVQVDQTDAARSVAEAGWLYNGGADGATLLLSTIAGSVIAVIGTTYATTIAVLTFASTQFGPRLLRNFLRDRGNQVVMGTYVATFMYCLLVMRSIGDPRGGDPNHPSFVPHASVAVAMLAEAICVGLLIYFIHHTAVSIQAPSIIANISRELMRAITRLYPGAMGAEPPSTAQAQADANALIGSISEGACVRFSRRGYIQALDEARLMRLAETHDLVLRLECGPGNYVSVGDILARVWPAAHVTPRLEHALNDLFVLGWARTQFQDHEYHLNQLVEIAVRALSPAINDPFTAMQCIDRLTEALRMFAQQSLPSPCRYDASGRLRVMTEDVLTFEELTSICFDKIRCYGQSSVDVTLHLLDGLISLAMWTRRPADLEAIRRHALMLERGAQIGISEAWDRDRIAKRFRLVIEATAAAGAIAR